MKIAVNLTIDLDEWELAFGVPRDEMREDVREYVHNLVQHEGVFGNGEVHAEVTLR